MSRAARKPKTGPSEVDLGKLDGFVGYHLRIAQTLAFQAFAREVGQSDLKPGSFAILEILAENPRITQMALSRANGRDKSSMTPVLDELVRIGLVERRRVDDNRRAYALELTNAGRVARKRLLKAAERHEARVVALLGRRRSNTLRNLLKMLSGLLAEG